MLDGYCPKHLEEVELCVWGRQWGRTLRWSGPTTTYYERENILRKSYHPDSVTLEFTKYQFTTLPFLQWDLQDLGDPRDPEDPVNEENIGKLRKRMHGIPNDYANLQRRNCFVIA